jgi:hypothetical protein
MVSRNLEIDRNDTLGAINAEVQKVTPANWHFILERAE